MKPLAKISELGPGQCKCVISSGKSLLLVNVDGNIYCVENKCSHQDYPLFGGEIDVDNLTIECPKHGSLFSLVDGNVLSLPATKNIKVYQTAVENGEIYLVNE